MFLELIPAEWRISLSKLPSEKELCFIDFTALCRILSKDELEIVTKDAGELIATLATGKVSCLTVTTAYCKAAAIAHQLTNCLTEIFFVQALTHAKELGEICAKTRKPTGALFGVPISLKDQIKIEGTECNIGVASGIG